MIQPAELCHPQPHFYHWASAQTLHY